LSSISFIHAESLLLDCPVIVEGPHSSDILQKLEEATLNSFESLLQSSMKTNIDFLLLTGNSFIESHESLRARSALVDGFQLLNDAGIPVFIFPGQEDPTEAWNQIPNIPSNVTIIENDPGIESETGSPIIVRRDQKTIATISVTNPDLLPGESLQNNSSTDSPVQIGLFNKPVKSNPVSFEELVIPNYFKQPQTTDLQEDFSSPAFQQYDYIAVLGLQNSTLIHLDNGMVHSPGVLQPRRPSPENSSGFSLVRSDSNGKIQIENRQVNPVCWQKEEIQITEKETKKSFLHKCMNRIRNQESISLEAIRIICWSLNGSGSLIDWLKDEQGLKEFQNELNLQWKENSVLLSAVEVTRKTEAIESSSESLRNQFHEAVQNELVQSPGFIRSTLKKLKKENEESELLQTLSKEIEEENIVRKSVEESQQWFS
jgi:DNA repair protein SbcD/Mre11